MSAPTYRCDGVKTSGRVPTMCKRQATVTLLLTGGRVWRACPSHDPKTGGRLARMLAPEPWTVLARTRTRDEV